MFSNKRGDWSSFKNIILLLLVAAILIPLTYIILNQGSRGAEVAACKNWVILQSAIKDPAFGKPIKELNNPCKTFQDTAKGERYEVYETIAKGMYDVWNMYGRGEIDFLTDKSWFAQFDSNVYCFIGDEISFDKDNELKEIDVDDFEDYLSHSYPGKSESTYSEFFMKAENSDIDFGDGIIETDPSEKLYIIYAVEKKSPDDFKGVIENVGKGALFSFIGITLAKGSIPGIKSLSSKKVFTGTFPQPRDSLGRFTKLGGTQTLRKAIGKAGSVGLIVGTLGTALYVTSDQSIMVPSLLVIQGEDVIKAGCEAGIHYKPKLKSEELKFKNE